MQAVGVGNRANHAYLTHNDIKSLRVIGTLFDLCVPDVIKLV